MGGIRAALLAATTAALTLAGTAFAGAPRGTSAAPPFTMYQDSACDPGVNRTLTCTNSVNLDPTLGEAKTSTSIQTGNGGTALDAGEAHAASAAAIDLYLSRPAASTTVTLGYEVVTTPTVGGTPDNRAGNFLTLSATAGCASCEATTTVTLSSSNPAIGTSGATPGSRGSIQVTISNPNGGLLPKGRVHVWAQSESVAFIGTGVGTGAGNAFANADNEFLFASLT